MKTGIQQIFLSSVLDQMVINNLGQELGKLKDLIMTSGPEYPELSHILVQRKRDTLRIPWQRVALFNRYVISIYGSVQRMAPYRPKEGEVLLRRDLLDRQIVDVNGAKVVRVNDLKLGSYRNRLCVFGVDVGFRGLLRRMGYEKGVERMARAMKLTLPHKEIPWQYVQLLERHLSPLTLKVAREQLGELHPADLAQILSLIPSQNVDNVLNSLTAETAGEAIHELQPELRSRVIRELTDERALQILSQMDPDEAADVLGDLAEDRAEELLGLMTAEQADELRRLMEHEEDTVGALMNTEFISIGRETTAAEALDVVRQRALEVDTIYYLYVLDQRGGLEGVVSLKELLVASPKTSVSDLMTRNLKYVHIDSSPAEALEMVAKYNFVAIPAVDREGAMEGIVSIDDLLERFVPWGIRYRRHRQG